MWKEVSFTEKITKTMLKNFNSIVVYRKSKGLTGITYEQSLSRDEKKMEADSKLQQERSNLEMHWQTPSLLLPDLYIMKQLHTSNATAAANLQIFRFLLHEQQKSKLLSVFQRNNDNEFFILM